MNRKVTFASLFVFLLALSLLLGPSIEAQTSADGLVVVKRISKAKRKAALEFWTHEKIAAAQPLTLPTQEGAPEVDAAALNEAEAVLGPAGSSNPGFAAPDADAIARKAYAADWAAMEASAVDAPTAVEGTPGVFTSYIVNQWAPAQKIYPHRWIGRLSFRTPSGTSYCSGTSISGNVMLTAAHCLYDSTNNRWYSNWVFTPAYRNGSAPYGTFPARTCWVLTAWVNLSGSYAINTWARHDVGVCKMGNNSAGQTLNNAVGWMGRQWNFPYVRHFHDNGYPFRNTSNTLLPNAGLFLRLCAAESFLQTTETRGLGCNWGGGISGGPWVFGYAPNVVTGWADGVNSGIFVGANNIYGARFNSSNIVVLCNAAVC